MRLPFWNRRRRDAELDEEIRGHLEMAARERTEQGVGALEAVAAARREFGNVGIVREATRGVWKGASIEGVMQVLRTTLRGFLRAPAFATTAVLMLALGIGISTAVFTVANTLLLRELPVQDQDRLVTLWGETLDGTFNNYPLDLADAHEFTRQTRSLERVGSFAYEGAWPTPFRDGDRVTRLRFATVSGNFFDVLGAAPAIGRTLRAEDDVVGAAPVAVLSHAAWRGFFGGSAEVIGRRIQFHATGMTFTIVGVMPQGLDYPRGTEVWAPVVPTRTIPGTDSTVAYVDLIGRLESTSSPTAARDELTDFFRRQRSGPAEPNIRGVVNSFPRLVVGEARPAVIAFTAAAGLLLLITCINVANLLLVRGLTRVREIAMRSALGASRRDVVAHLLIENGILATAGGALGVGVAIGAVRLFVAFAPAGLPRLDEIRVDAVGLVAAIGITAVAMLLFGLAPAFITSRVKPDQVLRHDNRHSARRWFRLASEGLVVGQLVLAVLVLSAAGLIVRSLLKLESVDLSFEPSRLAIAELSIRYDRFDTRDEQLALLERLTEDVRGIPGVESVSPVVAVPFSGSGGWDGRPAPIGQTDAEASKNPMINMDVVSPDYFRTFEVPVLRGRSFSASDREGAPAVVVLSEGAARRYWPSEDPVGKRLVMGPGSKDTATVVGIVPDTRYRDLRDARASIYFPLHQSIFPFAPTTLAIRSDARPDALLPSIRRVIGVTDPAIAVSNVAPFDSFLDKPLAQPRFNALLLVVFAGAAVTLAAVGLFGVVATMVRQRTRELGVRMALGATATSLRRMVMGRGLVIAATGLGLGLAGAVLSNRLLVAVLYEVSPADPVTIALVAVLLLVVAVLASIIPAWATTRIDPVLALRAEG